jgi:uncharacterized protein DUF6847
MKLAEALLLRSDLVKKLASLQSRAQKFAMVQEGEKPAEDPRDLFVQIDAVAAELQRLISAINHANLKHTLVGKPVTLTEALSQRDVLVQRHRIYQSVLDACVRPPDRYGMKEIRWVASIDIAVLQKRVDDLAKEIRELNAAIQEAGWRVELAM